jgi:hypothetical protein
MTGGGMVDTVTLHLSQNLAGGDLYIMGDIDCQPDITNILASRCCAVDPLTTGAPVQIHFPPVNTSAVTPTWVVLVERTGSAGQDADGNFNGSDGSSFRIARDTTSGDEPGRAYANLVGTGNPGDWSDLFDPYGQCYVVGLSSTGQDPDIVDCADFIGSCCLFDGTCQEGVHNFQCFGGEGSTYNAGVDCAGANCEPLCSFSGPEGPCGDPDAGPCSAPNGTPGCSDAVGCCLVCDQDPACCLFEWDQQCANAAKGFGCTPDLASADGLWTAELDDFGQIANFFPSTQPKVDNVWETLIYEANSQGDMRSRRIESNYTVVEGPTISEDGTSAFTRLEANDADLAIEIEILMLDGSSGGALVNIRCENTGNAAVSCKIFYYCDYDISGDFGDDEAFTIPDPPDPIRAIEQIDNEGGKGPKPLWFGGCPEYAGWEINTYPLLLSDLDAGRKALTETDWTSPGSDDHTAALSSPTAQLQPGETFEFQAGLGGVNFVGCASACPWDISGDGIVGASDLLSLLVGWGACGDCNDCPADFDDNCVVGASDLLALLVHWGPCP